MANQRRQSYGPTSPVVGARGAATRDRIAATALELFAGDGYHATTMEDIAGQVGVSRAALYQYFEGKDAIFIELVEESGAALQRVARNIGRLGPDADGFAAMHAWLTEWADVFDHYQPLFVEWANVNSPSTPLRPRMGTFVSSHTRRVAKTFSEAGAEADPLLSAILLTGVIERYHYIHAVHDLEATSTGISTDLAVGCQRLLFPQTLREVLPAAPSTTHEAPTGRTERDIAGSDRFDTLGPRARATVHRLLDVAGRVFADHGHTAATVEQIVMSAGVARGTAYKYFDGVDDIFGVLAEACGQEMGRLALDLGRVAPDDPASLRSWLRRFLDQHRRYSGVLRAWTMTGITDERVVAARDHVLARTFEGFGTIHSAVHSEPVLGPEAARLMFVAMLERTPDVAVGTALAPSDDQLVDIQATFVARALLDRDE